MFRFAMFLKTYFEKYLRASPEIRGTQLGNNQRTADDPIVGKLDAYTYTPQDVIAYAKRLADRMQPASVASYLGYWRKAMEYAEVGLGLPGISDNAIRLAMPFIKQHRLVGASGVRERIPTPEEHLRIMPWVQAHTSLVNFDVIDYQYHSGRRISEACRHKWGQFDEATKTILIINMKHPRMKQGHNKRAALTDEAFAIIMRQKRETNDPEERIFKACLSTVKGVYVKAKRALGITGLQLRDSRAGVVTRLLKDGYSEQEAQLVTVNGIAMIRQVYNRMRPEDFPRRAKC